MAPTAGARFNSALNLTEGGRAGTSERKAKTRGAESLAGGRDLEERGCPAPAFCAPVWGGIGAAPSDGGRGLAFASWALGSTLGCAAETCPGPPGRAAVAGRTPLLADARAARRILGERRLSWFPVSQETLVQPAEGSEAVVANTSNLWSAAGPSQWRLMNPASFVAYHANSCGDERQSAGDPGLCSAGFPGPLGWERVQVAAPKAQAGASGRPSRPLVATRP